MILSRIRRKMRLFTLPQSKEPLHRLWWSLRRCNLEAQWRPDYSSSWMWLKSSRGPLIVQISEADTFKQYCFVLTRSKGQKLALCERWQKASEAVLELYAQNTWAKCFWRHIKPANGEAVWQRGRLMGPSALNCQTCGFLTSLTALKTCRACQAWKRWILVRVRKRRHSLCCRINTHR